MLRQLGREYARHNIIAPAGGRPDNQAYRLGGERGLRGCNTGSAHHGDHPPEQKQYVEVLLHDAFQYR